MDQILRGIVASNHPENIKKSLVQQLVSKTSNNVPEDQNRSIFEIGTQWMTQENSQFLNETGRLLLTTWAKRQKDVFQKYFTEGFLLSFLAEREKLSVSCIDYLRTSLDLVQHTPQVFSLYTVVRHRAHIWVEKNLNTDFCAALARLLIEYSHCWPVGENLLHFNLSLINALSETELPKTSKEEMKSCFQNGAVIGALLNKMWTKNQALLFPVLTEIFKIVSRVGRNPSVALACVVQYFTTDIIDSATNLVAVNPSVSDESLAVSLSRMINWLSWPGAKKVDQWILGFLKALASAKKHSILISVTLKEVAQVFSRLLFPVVRESTMVVLSHMLLSFRHSPQAFHEQGNFMLSASDYRQVARTFRRKLRFRLCAQLTHMIVEHVPGLVQNLKKENSASSQSTLQTLAELMHCLMYQHTGFPELYGPVLDSLQDLPKPSEVMIRKWLAQSAWSAQAYHIPLTGFTPKSETGKTGLVNLGNTCYMNSVLQALYMLDEFRYIIFGHQTYPHRPLLHQLQEVFAFLSLTQRSAFAPSKFLQVARPSWFAPGTQQDCSEFLKFLLDRISEEDKSLTNSNNDEMPKTTLIDDTFAGKLLVCLCCRRCNSTSCREEEFTDLPLSFPQASELQGRILPVQDENLSSDKQPVEHDEMTVNSTLSSDRSLKGGDVTHSINASGLTSKPAEDADAVAAASSHSAASADSSMSFTTGPSLPTKLRESGLRVDTPHISITQLLEYFFEPEVLEGSNQYHCDQCNSLQDAERTVTISRASNFLVLTLKRFAYNVRTQQRSKILQSVSYPLVLKLPRSQLRGNVRGGEVRDCVPDGSDDKSSDIISQSCFKSKRTKQEHESIVDSASRDTALTYDEKSAADIVYSLCSVIVHSGTSSESGHYYCYARSSAHLIGGGGESDVGSTSRTSDQDTWFLFNDSRVSYSAFSTFADVSKRFPKDTPYVLIYKRVSSCATVVPIESRSDIDIPQDKLTGEIRPELADIVNRDNLLYLQERERQAVNTAKRKARSNIFQPPDDEDDNNRGPPGGCGSGPGFTTPFNRFVF